MKKVIIPIIILAIAVVVFLFITYDSNDSTYEKQVLEQIKTHQKEIEELKSKNNISGDDYGDVQMYLVQINRRLGTLDVNDKDSIIDNKINRIKDIISKSQNNK